MAAGTSPPGGLSFDDTLTKYVGEFGRSQIRILLLASLFWIGNGLLILLMVFHASPSPLKEHWWRCNDPADVQCETVFALKDPSRDVCSLPSDSWSWTQPSKSIISQFNLICGAAWRSQFANSGFFMGYLIGSGVFGGVADARGRKPVLFGCTALGAVSTLAAGLSPNYAAYFIFRLITGIGAAGQALTAYILATESVGPSWRGTAGVATQLFFIVGEFLLVLIAYLARPWRVLCYACAVVNAVLLVLWPTLPESPRWLLVRGRKDEATAILARIAAGNGRAMPSEPLADCGGGGDDATAAPEAAAAAAAAEEGMPLTGSQQHHHSHVEASLKPHQTPPVASPKKPVTLTSMLLRDRHMLRRFLVLAYVWLVMCMAYYGISLALGGLPGSIYVTFMITAAAELPANVLAAWMIERYGRHNTMAAGMLLGGAACLGCAFAPAGMASAALAAVGKFGCAGAFTVASIFTSEMFPTLVRSAVLGAENEAARVGGISAPFIVLVGISTGQAAMPFIIFGVTSLVAGVAIFTLPETLGTTLPDTMADMSGIQSIFTTQPWRRGGWRQTLREMFRARGGPPARASPAGSPTKDLPSSAAVATGTPGRHASSPTTVPLHAHANPYGRGYGATPGDDDGELQQVALGDEDVEVQVGELQPAGGTYQNGQHHSHAQGHGRDHGGANDHGHAEHHTLLHAATGKSDALRSTPPKVHDVSLGTVSRGPTVGALGAGSDAPNGAGGSQQHVRSAQSYYEHRRDEVQRFHT